MFDRERCVLILAGATGSGKTNLAIELALRYDAEIVGADSRQVYRDMPIGTAVPSPNQLAAVPHHCVAFLSPQQRYSAARFANDALEAIDDIHRRGKRAIVTGGTGFYIRALIGGASLAPQYDESLRQRLANEARLHPPEFVHAWLAQRDSRRAEALHPGDTYRVLRALEIALATKVERDAPLRTLQRAGIEKLLLYIDVPLAELDARIAARTDRMLSQGFIEEAERIGAGAVASNALGYPQAAGYLRGWMTRAELRALLLRNTRRYARRQRAWFRREPEAIWLRSGDVDAAVRERLGWAEKSPSHGA